MYRYDDYREWLSSDEGARAVGSALRRATVALAQAGAVAMWKAMPENVGDSWKSLACVDHLVALGVLREVPQPAGCAGQHRLFVAGRNGEPS